MNSRRRRHSSSSDDSDEAQGSDDAPEVTNVFRNDGSFLEMFKKMQQNAQNGSIASPRVAPVKPSVTSKTEDKCETEPPSVTHTKPTPPIIGRRRTAKILPVGKVKKLKNDDEDESAAPTDAWAKYLQEVKKYKETYCDSEAKTRSLVK